MKQACLILFFAIVLVISSGLCSVARSDEVLEFAVPVVRGLEKYQGLLEFPPYLALALDNSGIKVGTGDLVVVDDRTLQVNYVSLKFVKKEGGIYTYAIQPAWGLSLDSIGLNIRVEVDCSRLKNGLAKIRIHLFRADFFLSSVRTMIDSKMALVGKENQMLVLNYLSGMKGADSSPIFVAGMIEQIEAQTKNIHALSRMKVADGRTAVRRLPPPWHSLFISALAALLIAIPILSFPTFKMGRSRTVIGSK